MYVHTHCDVLRYVCSRCVIMACDSVIYSSLKMGGRIAVWYRVLKTVAVQSWSARDGCVSMYVAAYLGVGGWWLGVVEDVDRWVGLYWIGFGRVVVDSGWGRQWVGRHVYSHACTCIVFDEHLRSFPNRISRCWLFKLSSGI